MPPTRFQIKQAKKQGRKYGIPPKTLLGLMEQESSFNPAAISSAGAFGVTQFIPSTAAAYGVKRGTSKKSQRSQIRGAAKYLSDLDYKRDPRNALGRYYGSTSAPYASEVLAKAKQYRGVAKANRGLQRASGGRKGVKGVKVTRTRHVPPTAEERSQLISLIGKEDKSVSDYVQIRDLYNGNKITDSKSISLKGFNHMDRKPKGGKMNPDLMRIANLAKKAGLHIGEHSKYGGVARGVHVANSYHYQDRALDISGDTKTMNRFAKMLQRSYGKKITELYWKGGSSPITIKDGSPIDPSAIDGHTGHIHVAV